jgi:hypothetical protein
VGTDEKVHVGSGVFAPRRIQLSAEDLLISDQVEVEADVVLEGRRYVVESLTIHRLPGGPPVTGELIRTIPVQQVVKLGVAGAVETERHGKRWPAGSELPKDLLRRLRADGPTDATLSLVGQIYVVAELTGDPPAKNVSSVLGIPQPTANNWIRRAKDRGHIDVAEGTGKRV